MVNLLIFYERASLSLSLSLSLWLSRRPCTKSRYKSFFMNDAEDNNNNNNNNNVDISHSRPDVYTHIYTYIRFAIAREFLTLPPLPQPT
jgi:hypothetical protein